ncbi:Cytochrome P450-like protein 60 [Diaporthe eres]|nr:Cytochrome P450-like protein 60 [Diaporthe eres]
MSTLSNPWQSSGGGWLRLAVVLLAVTVLFILRRLVHDYQFTIKVGGTYWVVLNSRRTVLELLEKRSAKYSSRMQFPMASDLVSRGNRMLMMPYSDLWRRERKMMYQILNSSQLKNLEHFQHTESALLMADYLREPEKWYLPHGQFANSIIMSFLFGKPSELSDPRTTELLKKSEEFVKFLAPGATIVDAFPFLAKIDFLKSCQPWRWKADALYNECIRGQLDELEQRRWEGTHKPCFASELLDSGAQVEFTRDQLLYILGTLMEAGSDTTRMSMNQVIAGAALFPDWVGRARKELDAVCGSNAERLPGFADLDSLPWIKAAVKESLRWNIAETGIPHATTEDDEFEGYHIPAGTVVTYNNWGIANDPAEYDQPERFWPERFLDQDLDKFLKGHLGFGVGRRACVAYNVAAKSLLIAVSRLVYCFDCLQIDEEPIDTSAPLLGTTGAAPFRARIQVRSKAHQDLVQRAYTSVRNSGYKN